MKISKYYLHSSENKGNDVHFLKSTFYFVNKTKVVLQIDPCTLRKIRLKQVAREALSLNLFRENILFLLRLYVSTVDTGVGRSLVNH